MKETLETIAQTSGVHAALIYGAKDEILASVEVDARSADTIQPALQEIGSTISALIAYGEPLEQLDFYLRQRYLLARRLGGSWLIVLCDEQVDVAMLRMAVNVAIAELKESEGIRSFLSRSGKRIDTQGKSLVEIHRSLTQEA